VSVINEKHAILGEDLELKESLTVDVSTGKNSKGRLAVYKIICLSRKARNITWTPHLGEASCTIVQIHITQMNTAITTTV